MRTLFIFFAIVLAIGFGVLVGQNSVNLGASAGPEHFQTQIFRAGDVEGGEVTTKTAGTTTTWTAKDVCQSGVIKWVPSATVNTTTLPTAASLVASGCFPQDGMYKDVVFWNAGLTATATVAFTANTGNKVFSPYDASSTSVIVGGNIASVRFVRASSTGFYVIIDQQK